MNVSNKFEHQISADLKVISNRKNEIEHFVYFELPQNNQFVNLLIEEEIVKNKLKSQIKKKLGKNVPQYYTLKEINDLLLLHIVSFYHQFPYSFKVAPNLKSIQFKIKK